LKDALRLSHLRSMSLQDALLTLEYADPWTITRAFSVQFGYPLIDFYNARIPEDTIRTIPDVVVRDLEVCPVAIRGPVLWYATPHLADSDHGNRLSQILNRDVRPMWTSRDWILQADRSFYAECHVTEGGSASWFTKYRDEDWILMDGNRYQD